MKETLFFIAWMTGGGVTLWLGVQLMLFQPDWLRVFPSELVAYLAVLVLPTGVLTLLARSWLWGGAHE